MHTKRMYVCVTILDGSSARRDDPRISISPMSDLLYSNVVLNRDLVLSFQYVYRKPALDDEQ